MDNTTKTPKEKKTSDKTTIVDVKKVSFQSLFVDHLMSSLDCPYRTKNGNIYNWNHSYWKVCDFETEMLPYALSFLKKHIPAVYSEKNAQSCVKTAIAGLPRLPDMNKNMSGGIHIPTKDYMLNVYQDGRFTISDFDSNKHFHTYQINAYLRPYLPDPEEAANLRFTDETFEIPHVDYSTLFGRFLTSSIPDHEQEDLLAEWSGFSLTPIINGSTQAIYMIGQGGNGKSVFINAISALHQKVANMEIDRLNETQSLSKLVSSSLAVVSDAERKVNEGAFKKIIHGEPIACKFLYRDEFTFSPTAKWLISANDMPLIHDKSEGMWRRILFINFNQKINENDKIQDIDSQIVDYHLSEVLFWSLHGLRRLIKRSFIFNKTKESQRLSKLVKLENNSVLRFISERQVKTRNSGGLPRSEIFRLYSEFCESRKEMALSSNKFWGTFEKSFKEEYGFDCDTNTHGGKFKGCFTRFTNIVVDCELENETPSGVVVKSSKMIDLGEYVMIAGKRFKVVKSIPFKGEEKVELIPA